MVESHIAIVGKHSMERIHKWSIALMLLLLPMQTQWIFRVATWEFGSVRLLVVECVVLALAGVSVGSWWRERSVRARQVFVLTSAWLVLWGVWVSAGAVVALLQLVHMLSALALGVVVWEASRRWGVRWVLSWYLAGGMLWASLGLLQWIQQQVIVSTLLGIAAHAPGVAGDSVVLMRGERMLRVYGPMPHPNIFGALVVSYIYAAILLLRSGGSRVTAQRWIVIAVLTVCCVALVLSFSRSAWIAAVAVGLVAIPWRRMWRTWVRLLALPVCVTLGVVFLVAPGVAARFQGDNVLEIRSRDERSERWNDGVRLVQENPFWGAGLGLATTEMYRLDPSRDGWTVQPPHFTPLLIVAEVGIIGTAILLYCLSMLPWSVGLIVLIPALIFDHFFWSLPAGLFLLTLIWFLSTIQAKLALDQ